MWHNKSGDDFESGEARQTVLDLRIEEEHVVSSWPSLLSPSCTRHSAGEGRNLEAPTDKELQPKPLPPSDDQEKGGLTKWRTFLTILALVRPNTNRISAFPYYPHGYTGAELGAECPICPQHRSRQRYSDCPPGGANGLIIELTFHPLETRTPTSFLPGWC